jgi:hypothetical protein
MTFRAKPSGVPSSTGLAGPAPADPFILTLCRLAAPVAIKPPRAPHLKPFTFFTSRAAQPDGSERLYLHMGYFGSLEQAQKWAQLMRSAYPNAAAMRAPAALLRKRDSAVPTLAPPAASEEPLTDTQVLRILDTRRATPESARQMRRSSRTTTTSHSCDPKTPRYDGSSRTPSFSKRRYRSSCS